MLDTAFMVTELCTQFEEKPATIESGYLVHALHNRVRQIARVEG